MNHLSFENCVPILLSGSLAHSINFISELKKLYEFLALQFDVTFPAVACSLLSVDAMDISGEQHYDIVCFLHF